MQQDIQEWCYVNRICCAKKEPSCEGQVPLQLYQVGAPVKCIIVHIVRPLSMSNSDKKYLSMQMDYFTKWSEVSMIPNHEASGQHMEVVDVKSCIQVT